VVLEGNLVGDQGQMDEDVDQVYGMHYTWMLWHNLLHTDLQGYCSFHNPSLVVVVAVAVAAVHSHHHQHQLDNLQASLAHKDSVVLYHFAVYLAHPQQN
jgi:hypothetical protein